MHIIQSKKTNSINVDSNENEDEVDIVKETPISASSRVSKERISWEEIVEYEKEEQEEDKVHIITQVIETRMFMK